MISGFTGKFSRTFFRLHSSCRMLASVIIQAIAMTSGPVFAQSRVETSLQQFSAEAAKGYIQPLADLTSANLNSGFYNSAEIPYLGLHLRLDILVMGGLVTDEMKTYHAPLPSNFQGGSFETATIVGGRGGIFINPFDSLSTYRGSDGIISATLIPLAVPQLTLGALVGTEVTIRYFPLKSPAGEDLPDTKLFAFGIRHSISSYVKTLPIDIAIGYMYTRFQAEELIDYKGSLVALHASKSFSLLTLYGGIAWENGTLDGKYEDANQPTGTKVEVHLDAKNSARVTIGGKLSLGFFSFAADANIASVTSFTGGIGFEF